MQKQKTLKEIQDSQDSVISAFVHAKVFRQVELHTAWKW